MTPSPANPNVKMKFICFYVWDRPNYDEMPMISAYTGLINIPDVIQLKYRANCLSLYSFNNIDMHWNETNKSIWILNFCESFPGKLL